MAVQIGRRAGILGRFEALDHVAGVEVVDQDVLHIIAVEMSTKRKTKKRSGLPERFAVTGCT